MSDVFERNEITTAQMYLDKAATLSQQAKQLSPELQRLDRIQLPVPNFLIDLFLENAITDALFYERIANALADLEMAETVMMSQYIRRVNELVGDAKVEKNNSERELQERRKSLEKVRREILESARPNGKARM
jgi:hypothetical protein